MMIPEQQRSYATLQDFWPVGIIVVVGIVIGLLAMAAPR